ncbi:MAG: hypothetical protein ABIQ59_07115 [Nocardioidaceae bacterium]
MRWVLLVELLGEVLGEVLLDRRRGKPSLDLEGPGERSAADGEL